LLESQDTSGLIGRQRARKKHWLYQLVHNYLFFRIPLVRPQAFLDRTRVVGEIIFSKITLGIFCALGFVGILLAARQWDSFVATGLSLLDWEGAFILAACVPFVKTAHELGHAYMATRYHVRVPTMGIAFMVLAPFLYSDVTDAWRLSSRWQRLAIDCAGLLVELMIAAAALFLWVFMPPGAMRTAVFALATTSLLLGLMLNLNPFMRFDGYHILADFLGIPNLQTRAMVIGRWALREFFFGLGAPMPEQMSRKRFIAMAIYAYAIWIYRFFLFLGIAVLVYHFAFKALGIILFLIEIIWFILLPIAQEFLRWWKGRDYVARSRRATMTFSFFGIAFLAFIVPLPTSLIVPAVATARMDAPVFARAPGKLVSMSVREGQSVKAGEELARVDAPDISAQLRHAELQLDLKRIRLARAASNAAERAELRVLENEVTSAARRLDVLRRQEEDLILRSPHDGVIRDLNPDLLVGQWISPKAPLFRVLNPAEIEIRGYAEEPDLRRLRTGAQGRFLPDDVTRPSVPVILTEIGATAVETLDLPTLASLHEGPVQVVPERSERALKPLLSLYAVTLHPEGAHAPEQEVRGQVRLDGLAESMVARVVRRVFGVLIRESGA
jgi:putative peptide zinc metalloprotease protein